MALPAPNLNTNHQFAPLMLKVWGLTPQPNARKTEVVPFAGTVDSEVVTDTDGLESFWLNITVYYNENNIFLVSEVSKRWLNKSF